jgi:lipid-A-disaccharide synthase-like uncharacterized protein
MSVIFTGSLLIFSGILFLAMSHAIRPDYLILYWFASTLVLTSGSLFLVTFKTEKTSYFVCGECNKTFLAEPDLRKHYGTDHTKKDQEKKE